MASMYGKNNPGRHYWTDAVLWTSTFSPAAFALFLGKFKVKLPIYHNIFLVDFQIIYDAGIEMHMPKDTFDIDGI